MAASTDAPEVERLTAAIAAIHDHLHAGDVNAAHEACERAMDSEQVTQRNLDLSTTAKAHRFCVGFNALCDQYDVEAATVMFLPSATVPGATSIQLGGAVRVCKAIEDWKGQHSTYMGEHARGWSRPG